MFITLCKSKIHRATVTQANLNYEGSLTVDEDLLEAAGILAYEKVAVVNINNGARLETYVIRGKRKSGTICLNGAAARMGQPNDLIIIIAYSLFEQQNVPHSFVPVVVHVNEENQIRSVTRGDVVSTEENLSVKNHHLTD